MRDICVDKIFQQYKDKSSWIQCMLLKLSKFRTKCFEQCESSTGYVWSIIIYIGKNIDYNISTSDSAKGAKVVSLSENF